MYPNMRVLNGAAVLLLVLVVVSGVEGRRRVPAGQQLLSQAAGSQGTFTTLQEDTEVGAAHCVSKQQRGVNDQ
jgi:hypothetical protein